MIALLTRVSSALLAVHLFTITEKNRRLSGLGIISRVATDAFIEPSSFECVSLLFRQIAEALCDSVTFGRDVGRWEE